MTNTTPQQVGKHPTSSARAQTMLDGRRAESTRRRQRVLAALDRTATEGSQINASGIARAAGTAIRRSQLSQIRRRRGMLRIGEDDSPNQPSR